jgi:polyamine oxidase
MLRDADRDVTVIEARNTIGGRINTDRSLGFATNLGASLLHWAEGNLLVSYVKKGRDASLCVFARVTNCVA